MSAGESHRERRHPPREPRDERPAPPSVSPRLEAVVDAVGGVSGRLIRVWKALPSERRLAVFAALGLFVTLFLPWYQETVIARGVTSLRSLSESMTGWGAFSFVEAAVLLVAAGVLLLLFVRAEGEAFHVPGGDGTVVTVAGGWTCLLIIWRMFDKEGTAGHGLYSTTSGIEWGIFVALAVAGLLTYAGVRIRRAHEPEPALPGERPARRRRRDRRDEASPARGETEAATARPQARERRTPVLELDIEETWLALESDRARRGPPPPLALRPTEPARPGEPTPSPIEDATTPLDERADATTRLEPAADPTARLEPAADPTARLEPATDATAPLTPPPAAPAPRRRRPRSIAAPPSGDDPITVRRERD
jgi:hypothetical protein